MSTQSQRSLPPMEVNRVPSRECESESREHGVNDVHRLDVPLKMAHAKARAGRALKKAIEGRALKEFGLKSLISGVCSGEKVPEYLARIVDDKPARRRLALALLEDDSEVIVTTTVTIPQSKKAG